MNTQTFFTLGEAARQVGKTKPALSAAIKSGRLSVHEKTPTGYRIAAAELFRVYPPLTTEAIHPLTPELNPLDTLLREQIERERTERERERREAAEQIADLRRRLDQTEAERQKVTTQLTALLTDQSVPRSPPIADTAADRPRGLRALLYRLTG